MPFFLNFLNFHKIKKSKPALTNTVNVGFFIFYKNIYAFLIGCLIMVFSFSGETFLASLR